jgi:hypothetical protein
MRPFRANISAGRADVTLPQEIHRRPTAGNRMFRTSRFMAAKH